MVRFSAYCWRSCAAPSYRCFTEAVRRPRTSAAKVTRSPMVICINSMVSRVRCRSGRWERTYMPSAALAQSRRKTASTEPFSRNRRSPRGGFPPQCSAADWPSRDHAATANCNIYPGEGGGRSYLDTETVNPVSGPAAPSHYGGGQPCFVKRDNDRDYHQRHHHDGCRPYQSEL